tara:strand:- start:1876 stop:2142 length:267 start_codon:yes stop_codon:yes gene_type:complete
MGLFPRKRVNKRKFKLRTNYFRPALEVEEKTKTYKSGKTKKRITSQYDPATDKTVKRRVKYKDDERGSIKKDIAIQNKKRIKAHKIKD